MTILEKTSLVGVSWSKVPSQDIGAATDSPGDPVEEPSESSTHHTSKQLP
jgi:hypothetical protein